MTDKIATYQKIKNFLNEHKLRTEEDFTKGSVFMDVYDFQTYKFVIQITDTQIGISTEADSNPFTGHDHVFTSVKDAKTFLKQHLGLKLNLRC